MITVIKPGLSDSIQADTICIHGDGETALEFAREIRSALINEGIKIHKVSSFLK